MAARIQSRWRVGEPSATDNGERLTIPKLALALLLTTLISVACAARTDTSQTNTNADRTNWSLGGSMPSNGTGGNSAPPEQNSSGDKGGTFSNGTTTGGHTSSNSGTPCTPGVTQPVITDCGYPFTSGNPLTSEVFNENEYIRAVVPSGGCPTKVRVFFNDEHALLLGVRSVEVTTADGTVSTRSYPVSQLSTDPGSVTAPQTGGHVLHGDDAALDPYLRPVWPSLFVTDTTNDPSNHSGDWQQGGWPFPPDAVYGTWKAAVRTVDETVTPNTVVITPDQDPAKNGWNLGVGADPVPGSALDAGNQGFSTELVWNIALVPGHLYRMQAIIVDCNQEKIGCHAGEACINFCASGEIPDGGIPTPLDGGPQPPQCDPGPACDATHDTCPQGLICANNCCVWLLN